MAELDQVRELMRRGEFRAALRRIEALDQDPTFAAEMKAKLYLLAVRTEAGLRQVHGAAKWADKGLEAAEMWGSWEDVGLARLSAGIIYRELGDSARALQWLQLFLRHLDRYPTLAEKAGFAYYNLGLVHRMRKEYPEALQAYDQAIAALAGYPADLLHVHHNEAWLLLLLDRPADAVPHIEAAGNLVQEDSVVQQAMHLCLRALYLQRTGDINGSVALCEEVLGREGVPPLPMGQAAWIAVENAIRAGAWREAQVFSDIALQYALEAKEPALMNAVNDAKRRLQVLRTLAGKAASPPPDGE